MFQLIISTLISNENYMFHINMTESYLLNRWWLGLTSLNLWKAFQEYGRTLGRHLAHISCSHLLVMPDDSPLEPLQSCLHTSNIIAYQCRCSCVDFSCQSEECIFLELENRSYFRKQITTELPVASNNLAHRKPRSINLFLYITSDYDRLVLGAQESLWSKWARLRSGKL